MAIKFPVILLTNQGDRGICVVAGDHNPDGPAVYLRHIHLMKRFRREPYKHVKDQVGEKVVETGGREGAYVLKVSSGGHEELVQVLNRCTWETALMKHHDVLLQLRLEAHHTSSKVKVELRQT